MSHDLREIVGEDGYFCDREGRCFSTRSINGKGPPLAVPRPLKPQPLANRRYVQITCGRRKVLVHRAVAATWIGPCPNGMEVSHIDGDGLNNRVSNLEYKTHRENEVRKIEHGTVPAGEKHGSSVLTDEQVVTIRRRLATRQRGEARRIAEEYGVSSSLITAIGRGKLWRHLRNEEAL